MGTLKYVNSCRVLPGDREHETLLPAVENNQNAKFRFNIETKIDNRSRRKMTWDELRNFLERENEQYALGEAARHEQNLLSAESTFERRSRRLAGEYTARSPIDQACRQFARTGKWPQMDADATLYAHDRWIWAMWFSRWLDETGPVKRDQERWEWLTWLLVDSWHELGSWRWRSSQKPSSEQ